jgi:hypothetical protein
MQFLYETAPTYDSRMRKRERERERERELREM